MSSCPAHIHLKEDLIPKARHNSIPVQYHFKEQDKYDRPFETMWKEISLHQYPLVLQLINIAPWLSQQKNKKWET